MAVGHGLRDYLTAVERLLIRARASGNQSWIDNLETALGELKQEVLATAGIKDR